MILLSQYAFLDLTNNVEDTEDTIVVLLARMESLESANNLLQETVDLLHGTVEALQETVDVLNNTVIALQSTDNTTNDRLHEIEIDLQGNYRPHRSCGKVMFLHLCVSHSVHRGVCVSQHALGQTPPGQTLLGRQPPSDTPLGRHPPTPTVYPSMYWGDTPCVSQHALGQTAPFDNHCSGRYASSWNAFLFCSCVSSISYLLSILFATHVVSRARKFKYFL